MSLRNIFDGLEKSSDKWEPYFSIYENHINPVFRRLGQKPTLTLVEVGVQKGGSLEMWSRYLSPVLYEKILIYGIDIDEECRNLKYDPNVEVVIGDQNSPEFWDQFLARVPEIDIFIDDGGHYMNQQILTFEKVFPKLSTGGVYFCEDCHTSYMRSNGGGLERRGTFIEYAKKLVDVIHFDWKEEMTTDLEEKYKIAKDLSGIHFYDSMVVIEKGPKEPMRRVFPKRHSTM